MGTETDCSHAIVRMIDATREKLLAWEPPWMSGSFEELRIMIDRDLRSAQLSVALASGNTAPCQKALQPEQVISSAQLYRWREEIEKTSSDLLMVSGAQDVRQQIDRLGEEVFEAYLDEVAREARAV